MNFRIEGMRGQYIEARGFTREFPNGTFETQARADAQDVADEFPKSYRVRIHTAHGMTSHEPVRGCVTVKAMLYADGVNDGKNEAGLDRVRKFIRKAKALGHEVEVSSSARRMTLDRDERLRIETTPEYRAEAERMAVEQEAFAAEIIAEAV
jgi:hypothetical protein